MRYKILVLDLDSGETLLDQTVPNLEVKQEQGYIRIPGGIVDNVMPNGHRRVELRGWSGCNTWDEFQAESR